jgi:hypothetical protein
MLGKHIRLRHNQFVMGHRSQIRVHRSSASTVPAVPAPYGLRVGRWQHRQEAKTAVSPEIGLADYGDGHVRLSVIENDERTSEAIRGVRQILAKSAAVQVCIS